MNAVRRSFADRRSIPAEIAVLLREEILDGVQPPDVALRQGHLALRFDTSQATIREALRQLEAWGLAVSSTNRGVRAAPLDIGEAAELGELRRQLEPSLARLAALRPDRVDVTTARAAIAVMEAAPGPADLMTANDDFHDAIYRAAGRPVTLDLVRSLRGRFERHLRLMWRLTGHAAISNDEHADILRLVLAGLGDEVHDMMAGHIERSTAVILRALGEANADRPRRLDAGTRS